MYTYFLLHKFIKEIEMSVEDWKRDELFVLFSKRTNIKNKENYIVNAIWH